MQIIIRILATLITGGTMLVGGIMLVLAGPPTAVALGVASATVGIAYTAAGILAEPTRQSRSRPNRTQSAARSFLAHDQAPTS